MVLTKLVQNIKDMTAAMVVILFQIFLLSNFLRIQQNVNMAINAIMRCGLTSIE